MRVIGIDVETDVIKLGSATPPLVCLSAAGGEDTVEFLAEWLGCDVAVDTTFRTDKAWVRNRGGEWEVVTTHAHALDLLLVLMDTEAVLVAQNGTYDWGVMVNENPELLPLFTALLEAGLVACTMVREQLIAIATDNYKYDDRRKRKDPIFSLDYLVMTYFHMDISASKTKLNPITGVYTGDMSSWRLRYMELHDVDIRDWPIEALIYSAQDSIWARRIYIKQGKARKLAAGVLVHPSGVVQDELPQTAADWVLHLMACHGVYTDHAAVLEFERVTRIQAVKAMAAGAKAGFVIRNRCKECVGTGWAGEVPSLVPCPVCEGHDHDYCNEHAYYGRFKNGKAKELVPPKTKTSQKRLRAIVDDAYGFDPPMTKKKPDSSDKWKPQISIDNDSLMGSGNPLLEEYGEGKSAIKMLETYLPILLAGTDLPIVSRPNVLVRSGRTSWRNPNFQNPPAKGGFRECFIPRRGKVFCSIDYSTVELCTLAQVCLKLFGFSKLGEAINAGKDVHLAYAAEMFLHMPYEEAKAIHDDPTHPRWEEVDEKRDRAKPANFGFPGMLGVKAYVDYAKGYGINLTFNEADEHKKSWFKMWPEMVLYKKLTQTNCKQNDGKYTVKQMGSGRLRAGCTFCSGANTWFQGLAADGAKAALYALYKACYLDEESVLYGVRMWAFIHDEVMFEGPEETAHLWAPEAARIMVEAMTKYIPDVPSKAEPALMRRWSKKAKTVYDENNKLVPWEPKAAAHVQ